MEFGYTVVVVRGWWWWEWVWWTGVLFLVPPWWEWGAACLKKKKNCNWEYWWVSIYIHVSQPCSRTLPTMVTALSRRSCFLIFSRLQPLQLPPIHLCLSSNRHSWLNVPKFVLVAPRTIDLCYNSWQPLCVCNFLTVGHRSDIIGGNTHTDTHTFGAQVHSTSTYK